MIEVKNLSFSVGEKTIIDNINFSVNEGEWLMIVGPNGSGKSTIVNSIGQSIPYQGEILFQGKEISQLKPIEKAKSFGILMQSNYVGYSFSIEEIVKMGRYAYTKGMFNTPSKDCDTIVEDALKVTGLYEKKDQSVLTLSGGELQRTFLAQLLAQDPKLLILDEPTNHLDLVYQKQVFSIINDWLKLKGRAVISVVHDLSLAKMYGTKAMLMHDSKMVSYGSMDEVLTKENLKNAYTIDVHQWMNDILSLWQ